MTRTRQAQPRPAERQWATRLVTTNPRVVRGSLAGPHRSAAGQPPLPTTRALPSQCCHTARISTAQTACWGLAPSSRSRGHLRHRSRHGGQRRGGRSAGDHQTPPAPPREAASDRRPAVRVPAYGPPGGGAAPPGRILGPRVRRPAPRIRVDGVPLGSGPRAARPPSRSGGRIAGVVPGAACETPGAFGLAQSSILLVNTHSPWIADWMPALEDRRHAERWK